MHGLYENFPDIAHGIAYFTCKAQKRVQLAIVTTFHQLNQERKSLGDVAFIAEPTCEVGFEFGVGEGIEFAFLDKSEMSALEVEISKKGFATLDFLCVLQYHVVARSGVRNSLKFDYYMLRFAFRRGHVEFHVFHERGPQHVHVGELMDFLIGRVKSQLEEEDSASLEVESLKAI